MTVQAHPLAVDLRALVAGDVPVLAGIERALFGAGAWSAAMVAGEIGGPGRWYVGAVEPSSGELVGYAGLWFDGDDAHVMTIGVTPAHQGRGVGRVLLGTLTGRARALGAARLLLEVRVDNEAALALYGRAGFVRLGRRRGYYQPENVDAWVMSLGLRRLGVRAAVLVTAADLAADLAAARRGERPAPVLLDVRWALGRTDGAERHAARHVPGAVYVDLESQLAAPASPQEGRHPLPARADLEAAARQWGVREGAAVVAYDDVCGMSAARAWWLLRWAGVRDVRVLDGGLAGWVAAGGALEAGDVEPEPGDVVLGEGFEATLDADAAADWPGLLLDARAGERYRGEAEPVDPRAGHIPGAVSAPTADNLAPDGTFLAPDALSERFAALGVRVAEAGPAARVPIGVYCGSGVTAAHEILALASLGVSAALYLGSWSQWSADPARPAATGGQP